MEVCNIVQEAVTKTSSKKMKFKKAKWLSEEALQIAEERKEVRGGAKMAEEQDGETTFSPTNSSKEHLNAEQTTQNNF